MIWYISPRTQEKWQRSGMAFLRTVTCGQFCWETGGKPAQQGELQFLWPCSRKEGHWRGRKDASVAGAQWPKWGWRSLSQGDGGNTDDAGPFKAIAWTLAFSSE